MFTVVIPFYNGHQYLDRLLPSIPESIPVILVDDLSDKPLTQVSRPNTQIIRLTEKGYFTGAVNKGIEACDTDVLILNQDTYFTDDSWLNFIDENKPKYGLFGERAGTHPAWPNRYIHGTFMYIRRDVIDKVGLMDTDNYPLWGSTCEYQLRACRKGFKANPARQVPGFVHKRRGPYGSAIQQSLQLTGQRSKFIKSPPAISVVITCYNYGRYLEDAINSLIGGETSLGNMPGQTRQDFEIIIVDDGSTDNSTEIAESLADPWQGIHLIRQQNKGSASAMNTGIQASHVRKDGLIAPLDGDDMMESLRLERMLVTYEDNPHSVIYDNIQYFGSGKRGVITDWQTMKKMDKLNLKGYDFERMLDQNAGFGMHKGLLYPKRAWEEAGGYPEIMTKGREDWAFNIALGIKGWCGVNAGGYDYLYRREGQGRSSRNTTPKHHSFFLGQIKSLFPSIYAGERPEMCCGRPSAGNNGKAASMAIRHSKDLPGQEGMVILEYVGNNAGDTTWTGSVTRTSYLLGGARKRGYVDKRDAPGLLASRKHNKPVFIQIEAIEERQTEKIIPSVLDESAAMLVRKSIPEVKKILPGSSLPELEAVLKAEKANKNRSTAISAIEAQLEVKSVQLV